VGTPYAAGELTPMSAPEVPDLLTGMATTRAIRRIAPDPIPDDDLSTIMWHATRAPSGSNRQPARFVVLRDGSTAERAKAILGQGFRDGWADKSREAGYGEGSSLDPTTRKGRSKAAMDYFVEHFEEIPVVVLACIVRHRKPGPSEGASVYPACQNLLLAARALGYGGVMTGWHAPVEDELRDVLGIPDGVGVSATIPLGRPLGHHGPVRRLPVADVVFDGAWGERAEWVVDPPGTGFAGPPPVDRIR